MAFESPRRNSDEVFTREAPCTSEFGRTRTRQCQRAKRTGGRGGRTTLFRSASSVLHFVAPFIRLELNSSALPSWPPTRARARGAAVHLSLINLRLSLMRPNTKRQQADRSSRPLKPAFRIGGPNHITFIWNVTARSEKVSPPYQLLFIIKASTCLPIPVIRSDDGKDVQKHNATYILPQQVQLQAKMKCERCDFGQCSNIRVHRVAGCRAGYLGDDATEKIP